VCARSAYSPTVQAVRLSSCGFSLQGRWRQAARAVMVLLVTGRQPAAIFAVAYPAARLATYRNGSRRITAAPSALVCIQVACASKPGSALKSGG